MQEMGLDLQRIRAGYANMFLSQIFAETFADCSGCPVELYNTDGALGAARGAGFGSGYYSTFRDCFRGMDIIRQIDPDKKRSKILGEVYGKWKIGLEEILETNKQYAEV